MRKRGARPKHAMRSYLLLPHQIARYVTPMHMALELLPLGLFNKDHGNHLAMVINLVAVDAAASGNGMWAVAKQAGDVLTTMYDRVKAGKTWNTTGEERKILAECITKMDRYLRTWTSARLITAAATVDAHNEEAVAHGHQFLDRTEYEAT